MPQICNKFLSASGEKPRWEETPDGFLRTKARILKEGVYNYLSDEFDLTPEEMKKYGLKPGEIIPVYISLEEMGKPESLRTLEGSPIVIFDHTWMDPETISEHEGKGEAIQKGSVAGTPSIDGQYLVADLLATHPDAIEAIKSKQIGEISAAYLAPVKFEDGEFEGKPYRARQHSHVYNHIAVIPEGTGRCGLDVKIINKKSNGGNQMSENKITRRIRLRNTGRVVNVDEEAANAIEDEQNASEEKEQQASGEATESKRSLEETVTQLEGKNDELATLQQEIEELKGELSVYKQKLDELLDGGAIEAAAEEMNEEQAEAGEILENMAEGEAKEEDREKIKNMRVCNGKPLRKADLHKAVLGACGIKVENMSDSELRGAFKAQVQLVRAGKTGARRVNGSKVMNTQIGDNAPVQRTARERLGIGIKK